VGNRRKMKASGEEEEAAREILGMIVVRGK